MRLSPSVVSFCEGWIPEFVNSVSMFTGNAVTLESPTSTTLEAPEEFLWQGQVLERKGSGTIWLGTPLAAMNAIAAGLAEDSEERTSAYRELLRQSFEGAAHLLSGGETPRLVCVRAIEDDTRPSGWSSVASVTVVTSDGQRIALLLVFDARVEALLSASDPEVPELESRALVPAADTGRLERLIELELPMKVVIGRCKVSIREATKLSEGSLVGLDRRGGEPVEVVVLNTVVARGELVSIDGSYGVRITELMSRAVGSHLYAMQSQNTASRPVIH